MKNRIVIILAIISAIFFFSTLKSCTSALNQKSARDKEMAARLALEEKINNFSQERLTVEEKVKAKEKEVQDIKAALESTKAALVQSQLINQSLKEELQKVTKLKEILENSLREAKEAGKKLKK